MFNQAITMESLTDAFMGYEVLGTKMRRKTAQSIATKIASHCKY